MKKDKILLWSGLVILAIVVSFIVFKPNVNSNEEVILTGEVKEFDIIAQQFSFEPSVIEVNKGDEVILNVESIDVTHGISLYEFGINSLIQPGETVRIEFIASKQGEFDFFCNVYCGSGHGNMKGTLIVK